jgi:hypothetical protein
MIKITLPELLVAGFTAALTLAVVLLLMQVNKGKISPGTAATTRPAVSAPADTAEQAGKKDVVVTATDKNGKSE